MPAVADWTTDADQTALVAAVRAAPGDSLPRLVLADWWQEHGREDVARVWRDQLPPRKGRFRSRIDSLTDAERRKLPAWAKRWIEIGLCTEPADRPLFEAGVAAAYRFAGLNQPRVVWCPSPLVAVLAGSVGDAVDDAVAGVEGGRAARDSAIVPGRGP